MRQPRSSGTASYEQQWAEKRNPVGLRDALATLAGRDDTVVLKAYWSSLGLSVLPLRSLVPVSRRYPSFWLGNSPVSRSSDSFV
jgi:hypothetical protein